MSGHFGQINTWLRIYFVLELGCSQPVITSLDFAFMNGDVQFIWLPFRARLGKFDLRMLPGERAHFMWAGVSLDIIFMEHSFDIRYRNLNWRFRYGDLNVIAEIDKVCTVLEEFKKITE
jgi:hypothetical protein